MKKFLYGLIAVMLVGWMSQSTLAQTVSIENVDMPWGHRAEAKIMLSSGAQGINDFEVSVTLSNNGIGYIEDVILPASFNKVFQVNVPPGAQSATISGTDADRLVEAGPGEVLLATLVLRGTASGVTQMVPGVNRLTNDLGQTINPFARAGELEVTSNITAPTISMGSGGTLLDKEVDIPLILNTTPPAGLESYRVTLELADDLAQIKSVRFDAFSGESDVEMGPGGQSVSFEARDTNNNVMPGATGIVLAWVRFEGLQPGATDLGLTINRINGEGGASASATIADGKITVSGIRDTAPEVASELPRRGTAIEIDQPTIQIEITDESNEVVPSSIRVVITDGGGNRMTFDRSSNGTVWDGRFFTIDLQGIGASLAGGRTTVEVTAADGGGKSSTEDYAFTVNSDSGGTTPPPSSGGSIDEAVAGSDCVISDSEIRNAITMWILGEPVPGTNNQTISDTKIRGLITSWILGERVC